MNPHRTPAFTSWALGALLVTAAQAADWPRWRGPLGDGHATTSEKVPSKLPAELKTTWRVPAGPGLASPVVAAGKVFAFDNQDGQETLRALAVTDGKEIWRQAVDSPFTDSQGPTGPRCTPVVDADRVYVVSCKGELQCRSVADGKLVWRTRYTDDFGAVFTGEKGNTAGAARHGNDGSPLVDGDLLIACAGGMKGAGIVAFDKRSGAVRWKSQDDQAGYAPPVVATLAGTRQYVCFTAEAVIGLAASDGKLLWRFPVKTAFGRHVTTPVVLGDIVAVASHTAGLMGLKIESEGGGQKVSQAWVSKDGAMNFSSPVRVAETLYGLGPSKDLVAVDLPTGNKRWSQEGWFTTSADKAYAGFLVLGGNVLTLTDGGTVGLFAADATTFKELGRVQVCGANWCNPAYSDGRLYLRDAKNWHCVVIAE